MTNWIPLPIGPAERGFGSHAPVAKESVHRTSADEVLITGARALGGDRFLVGARWRPNHRPFAPGDGGRHNPLLIAESIRQACIHLGVRFFDVPLGTHFVIRELHFDLDPPAAPEAKGEATDVLLVVQADKVRRDATTGQVEAMALSATYLADGRPFAGSGGSARLFDDTGYATLRAGTRTPQVPQTAQDAQGSDASQVSREALAATGAPLLRPRPEQVGVIRAEDVALGRSNGGDWSVSAADPRHPFFYDHAVDHLPGMLMLEAARQFAVLQLNDAELRLTSVQLRPLLFAEALSPARFAAPATASAEAFPFQLLQAGQSVLEGRLSLARATHP